MADKTEKRDVAAQTLRATFKPGSVNDESRTVDLIWTTGARVLRGYYDRFWEELSLDPKHVRMGRLNNGAPLLADHAGYRAADTLGVIESAKLEKGQGTAVVRFAKAEDDPEADKVFRKIKDGIIQNVSVGYRVHKLEKVEDGVDKIPVYRATDWEPHEISVVAMGADDGAGFRSAETSNNTNPCEFITRGLPHQESKAMTPEEIAAAAEAKARDLKIATDAAALAERERASGIRSAVRAAKLDDSMAEKMVADGIALDAARAQVLNELATRSDEVKTEQHVKINVTDDVADKFARGVSAWLHEKAGNGLVARAAKMNAKGFEKVELDGGEFRGMKIVDIARACLELRGVSLRGVYGDLAIIKRALEFRSGQHSTGDFSVLFENVMFKQMRASYAVQDHTWKRWCGTDTVGNFLTHNRFLNGSFGTLPVVAENGEYQNIAIPDGAKNTISTETRGGIISLSRQAMINDDMGALADVATRFGATAGRSIDVAAYALLGLNSGLGPTMADSQAFFHSNRANVSTSAALSVAALDADKVHMRAQRDISSNDYLDLQPSILLVPVGLESAAKVINASSFDHDSTKLQRPNPVQGMFADIVSSPRAPSSGTTRRYLFTAAKEAFKVVFLEGTGEGPVMESEEGFRVDGLQWKARIDFKVNAYDPKTALTNAGT